MCAGPLAPPKTNLPPPPPRPEEAVEQREMEAKRAAEAERQRRAKSRAKNTTLNPGTGFLGLDQESDGLGL